MDDRAIRIPVELDDKEAQKELAVLTRKITKLEEEIQKNETKESGLAMQIEAAKQKADELRAAIAAFNKEALSKSMSERDGIAGQIEAAKKRAQELREEITLSKEIMQENALDYNLKANPTKQDTADFNLAQKSLSRDIDVAAKELAKEEAAVEKLKLQYESLNQTIAQREASPTGSTEQNRALAQQEALIQRLTAQQANLNQVTSAQRISYSGTQARINEINGALAKQANEVWPQVRKGAAAAMSGTASALKLSLGRILKFGIGVRSIYVLFNILRKYIVEGFTEFAKYDAETEQNVNNLKSALSGLKGALGAMIAPIYNLIAPALTYFINLLAQAANAVQTFFAVIQGKTTFTKASGNLSAVGAAAGGAADEMERLNDQFTGLDEINKWQDDKQASGGGGGGGSGIDFVGEEIDPDSKAAKLGAFVKENLESVQELIDIFGFTIGMVLAFTGANIPLGLGMMVFFGYRGIKNIVENWGAIKQQLQGTMGEILAIAGGALLAIGILLLAFGGTTQLPLAIGLIAVGAASLVAVTVANWESIKAELQGRIGTITAIASTAALAIGILLVIFGGPSLLPVGIGLIAAGTAGIVAVVAANWDNITGAIKSALESVKQAWEKFREQHPVVAGIIDAVFGFVKAVIQKTIEILTNIFKGKWIKDAWTAISAAGKTVIATVKAAVKKAATWIKDAWTAIKQKAETVTKTVKAAIKKAATWVADAWAAVKQKAETVIKTVKAAVSKAATWVADAWAAVKQKAETVTKTIQAAVKKASTWVADAWEAAKMKTQTIVRTVQTAVQKAKTWLSDAWEGAKMVAGTVLKIVQTELKKGNNWDTTVWNIINKVGAYIKDVAVNLIKQGWSTVVNFVDQHTGGAATKAINLVQGWYGTVKDWITTAWGRIGGAVEKTVNLAKGWTNTVADWIKDVYSRFGGNVSKTIDLAKGWIGSVADWVRDKIGGTVEVGIELVKSGWNSIKGWLGLSGGGIVTSSGFKLFASGGIMAKHFAKQFAKIPAYAGGTSQTHGTLFVAGENGSEVVGNIGGHTEVLNRSQLAAVMYASVINGMSRALSPLNSVLYRIAAAIESPRMAFSGVAGGYVIPPHAMDKNSTDELANMLKALLNGRQGGGNMHFTAQINRRTLFDEVISEARIRQSQTGHNPFDF